MNTEMHRLSLAEIEQELRRYLLASTNAHGKVIGDLGRNQDFMESDIFDSLSLLDFVLTAERVCGIKIPGEDIVPEHFGSLEKVIQYLQDNFRFR